MVKADAKSNSPENFTMSHREKRSEEISRKIQRTTILRASRTQNTTTIITRTSRTRKLATLQTGYVRLIPVVLSGFLFARYPGHS